MSFLKRVTSGLVGLLFLIISVLGQSIYQNPMPDASIMRLVPQDTAIKAAMARAKEIISDQIFSGRLIFCSDRAGRLGAYIVVFRIGEPFPSDQEIQLQINTGSKYEKMILSGEYPKELAALLNSNAITNRLRSMRYPLIRPDGKLTGLYQRFEKEELLKLASKKKYGSGDYISIYVSSSFETPPVPYIKKSLPPFYYSYEAARKRAARLLSTNSIALSHYYFLGLDGEYFEFRSLADRVLINAYSQKELDEAEKGMIFNAYYTRKLGVERMKAYRDMVDSDWAVLLKK